jgi:hypothetical protein
MKINVIDTAKIQAALDTVNRNHSAHVFRAPDLQAYAADAERQLEALGLCRKDRNGSMAQCTSGSCLPNAYQYTRTINTVTLKRSSARWFVVSIETRDAGREAGRVTLMLEPWQDRMAVQHLRRQYLVTGSVIGVAT